MSYRYTRRYTGPVRAVIFDWAGTTVDFGCMAPVASFVRAFAEFGVEITLAEARAPMGAEKRDHVAQILAMDAVRTRWRDARGNDPVEADVDAVYERFKPLQMAVLEDHAGLIPGVVETVRRLDAEGIAIGANTGYDAAMSAVNERLAAAAGYAPSSCVAAGNGLRGRPYPDMALKNMIDLGAPCVQACVKVDDTVPGIEEGLAAGMWTVGVAVTGNEVGLSYTDWEVLPDEEKAVLRARATRRLAQAGAHYVIDGVADLFPVIEAINHRLNTGEYP